MRKMNFGPIFASLKGKMLNKYNRKEIKKMREAMIAVYVGFGLMVAYFAISQTGLVLNNLASHLIGQ